MKIVTMGELMLRLSTPGFERFTQANSFDINFGGGEANVAVSMANYGQQASFVSKLPENEMGQAALNSLRAFGVDTSKILRGGKRLGIYYLETGASVRPSKVVYDRAGSSFAESEEYEYDWDAIFEGADWFHLSGITPALSPSCAALSLRALKEAKKRGVTVSFDLNYRGKLWTKELARKTLVPMMEYVDYCIGNEEDAEACLGFSSGSDVNSGKLDVEGYRNLLKNLCEKFNFKGASASLRESHSASDNGWSGALFTKGEFYHSKHYDIRLVDRVGGGDAFASGLIYGLNAYEDPEKAINFAVAASALKQTIPGDYNRVGVSEVEALMNGSGNGRVQR